MTTRGVWSFYDRLTGLFSGRTFSGPSRSLVSNTPEGQIPIEGVHDHLSKRVDLATGEVVSWRPDPPGDDYEWNTTDPMRPRWIKSKAAVYRETQRNAAVAEQQKLEREQIRSISALIDDPNDAEARAHYERRRDRLEELRMLINGTPDAETEAPTP